MTQQDGDGEDREGGKGGKDIGRRVGHAVGDVVGGAVGGVLSTAVRSVEAVGSLIGSAIRMPGLLAGDVSNAGKPGDAPGIETLPDLHTVPEPDQVRMTCVDYSPDRIETHALPLEALKSEAAIEKPEWASVRWVRLQGLHPYVINQLRQRLGFHTLAAEDVLRPPQRPRAEAYEDHIFVVTQFFFGDGPGLRSEQVGMFLYDNLLLTVHESREPIFRPIEERLERAPSRIRQSDASYLAYAVLDVTVDHCFPLLERYAAQLEGLEDGTMEGGGGDVLQQVHRVKRDLAVLRRVLWPVRELVAELRKQEYAPLVSRDTRAFLADVQDHVAQLVDMTEAFRELAGSVTDLYISMSSHRMNEIMQVLTVISTIFIPIGFLAGVFGMNFDVLPGLHWEYGYYAFWGVCLTLTGSMLWYFRHRGWFD